MPDSGAPRSEPPRDVPSPGSEPTSQTPQAPGSAVTRAGVVWVTVAVALILLVVLITFILQNPDKVQVQWFGLQGSVPLGVALLIAAVGGGVVVAVAGATRVTQLRMTARRARRSASGG